MRRSGHAVSLFILLASTAFAASAEPARPLPPVSEVQVTIGPQLQAKARDYGQRDLDMLAQDLKKDVESELRGKGRLQPGGARLMLTLTDATPDHPTATQLGNEPQLDPMRSVGRGSAVIDGVEIRPDGARRPVHVDDRQKFLGLAAGMSTWGDAETLFESFAREYAEGRR
jgi:hypothetical protein